jgi:hypothetical protein
MAAEDFAFFLGARLCLLPSDTSETSRIQLVLSGIQNRTSGPYLAAINRILILLMTETDQPPSRQMAGWRSIYLKQ